MKKSLGLLAATLALTVGAIAHADGAKNTSESARPTLPKGTMTIPKSSAGAPIHLGANERVDGFFVEVPDHLARLKEAPRYVQIWASQADRDERNRGNARQGAPVCFMNAYPSGSSDIQWSGSLNTTTTVQNYARAGYQSGSGYGAVQLVRSERVVKETSDKLTYEITFAYVDAETQGVRLVSKQTLEMGLVRELPGKVRVWGVGSDDEMTFVVRRPRHEKERFFVGPLAVTVNGVQTMSSSDGCPVVFSLKSQKGVASNAIVQIETLLDVTEQDLDAPASFGFSQKAMPQMQGPREAKLRPMRIGISSTWMSHDKAPVLSVASGWAGRERTQQI